MRICARALSWAASCAFCASGPTAFFCAADAAASAFSASAGLISSAFMAREVSTVTTLSRICTKPPST